MDAAIAYAAVLDNLSALKRVERHIVHEISKHPVGSPGRRDLLRVWQRAIAHRMKLGAKVDACRRRLALELQGNTGQPRWQEAKARAEIDRQLEASGRVLLDRVQLSTTICDRSECG